MTAAPLLIHERHRMDLRLALRLLKKAVKAARRVIQRLDLETARLTQRENDAEQLNELLGGWETAETLPLPLHLARTLRCGVAIEYDRLMELQEAQLDLHRDDSDTRKGLEQLNRLLALLDGQTSLPLEEPPPAPVAATQAEGESLDEAVARVAAGRAQATPAEASDVKARLAKSRPRKGK